MINIEIVENKYIHRGVDWESLSVKDETTKITHKKEESDWSRKKI